MSEDRSEQATAQRKQKAREKGDGVRSRELTSALATLAGVLMMGVAAKQFISSWVTVYAECLTLGFSRSQQSSDADLLVKGITRILVPAFMPLALILGACLTAALAIGIAQSGGVTFYPESIAFKVEKLNPVTNLQNLFSLRSIGRMGKSLIPAAVMVAFGYEALQKLLLTMPVMSLERLPAMLSTTYSLLLDAGWVMLGWSALDYAIEWRSWEQRLKMSKQEVREEVKESMGNPQVRGRIRSIQRQMRRRRMKADIARASVVITNPTHYAVALQFDFDSMQAPTVLAKGRNLHAEEIKKEARWTGVPIVENPPLARSLYRTVDPGQSIPYELYAAVASILAYLYRQQVEERARRERQKKAGAAVSHPSPSAPVEQPVAPYLHSVHPAPESNESTRDDNSQEGGKTE
ncbi:MAG: EscU/YscU/HrcU family type III secretion system export apparatus switch protein [Acidobacteriaceae bacterium]